MGCSSCNQNTPTPSVPCAECNPVVCATPQPCAEIVSSECVLHVGENKFCGLDKIYSKGDSLAKIFGSITDYYCNKTHTQEDKFVSGVIIYNEGDDVNTTIENVFDYFQDLYSSLPSPTGATILDKTHAQMLDLKNGLLGGLKKGQYYKITDFATMYERPDYNSTGTPVAIPSVITESVTPIIVLAISSSELQLEAIDASNIKDIIHYELEYITPKTTTATKGRIIYRKDSFGNESHYDHRKIKFKRYLDGSGIYSSYFDLLLGSQVFPTFDYAGYDVKNVKFGNHLLSANLDFDLPNVVFAKDVHNVSFPYETQIGTFLNNVDNVKFEGVFDNNLIKGICKNISFTEDFSGNLLNAVSDLNGSSFVNNITNTYFRFIQFEVGVGNTDFSTATHVYTTYTKKIFKNSVGTLRLSFYDSVDSEQVANITD